MRDRVWTYYESANMDHMTVTVNYLGQTGCRELASMFMKGIHDYQNPIFQNGLEYPPEWMNEAEVIDAWIYANEKEINIVEYELLKRILCEIG